MRYLITLIALFAIAALFSGCTSLSRFITCQEVVMRKDSQITLVYLGARDCHYCREWEENELKGFLSSPEIKEVQFLRIVRPTFRRNLQPGDLPGEYQWLYEKVGTDTSTPSFVLLVDRNVISDTAGSDNWQQNVLPLLSCLVTKKATAGE